MASKSAQAPKARPDPQTRIAAAAPDLLNACKAALSQLTEDREEYLESDIMQLQAAIAKAEAIAEQPTQPI